jgi:hypothetical protein
VSALASDPAIGNQHISVSFQPDGLSRRFGEPRLVIEQAAASPSGLTLWRLARGTDGVGRRASPEEVIGSKGTAIC